MKELLQINENGYTLNGKDFEIISGDIHYFRIYPTEWKRHLLLAKEFGLNTIQTYVPWNLHEPKKGKFNFEGILDLCEFLKLADEMGLKVLLRPSPYICSECDFGGLPAWLYQYKLTVRCFDAQYLKHVMDYYNVLIPKILPYLSTNGGPIIMVAVENEYGAIGYDKKYLQTLAQMLVSRGVDVPLYTTDCAFNALLIGSVPDKMVASNFRSLEGEGPKFYEYSKKFFPQFPFFVGEFWAGRQIFWGEPYTKRDPMETVKAYEECLKLGCVNFYMFSGGTNFGFFSGGVIGRSYGDTDEAPIRHLPHTTSYDEDALVSENGLPTEKYYLCRNVLRKHLGKEETNDRALPFEYETQSIKIDLTHRARLFDNLDVLTVNNTHTSGIPTMEDMNQETGFMLYSTKIDAMEDCIDKNIVVDTVADRATVYDGEKYIGKVERDRKNEEIFVDATNRDINLNILLESVGRINTTAKLDKDRKGILGHVSYQCAKLYGFDTRSLPMNDLSKVEFKLADKVEFNDNDPMFFKGTFDAKKGCDTFVDMRGWGRGFVVINGFNIGRFWEIGPQYSLYIPSGLLKEKDNEIIIFDVNHIGDCNSINTVNEAIWKDK